MATKIERILEAERRGILPADKLAKLQELRRRGLVPDTEKQTASFRDILGAATGNLETVAKTAVDPRRLQTPEALGVGQGAIQAGTLGFGVPLLRKGAEIGATLLGEAGTTEQVRPPTTSESILGAGLTAAATAGATGAVPTAAKAAKGAFIKPGIVKGVKAIPTIETLAKGAGLGFVFNPSDLELVPLADKRRFTNAAIGAATAGMLSVVSKAAKNISDLIIINSDKPAEVFGKVVVKQAIRSKRKLGNKFGDKIRILSEANKGKVVDISDDIAKFQKELELNPKAASIARRSKLLKRLIDEPEDLLSGDVSRKQVSLIELQDIKNDIQAKLPKGVLDGRNVTVDDFPVLDFLDDIADKQLSSFPGMSSIRAAYRKGINDWKIARNVFTNKNILSSIEASKGFKGAIERQAISRFLPTDLVHRMDDLGSSIGFQKLAIKGARRVAEATAIFAAVRLALGGRQ